MKKIMLSGGGSGGPVIPLLEITKKLKDLKSDWDFVFVGTEDGPEREMVENFGDLRFLTLPAGKFRRYLSFKNFLDIFKIIWAFFKAFPLLIKEKPSLVISAGSFASVPLVYAARFLRIPIIIHQQDVRPGLANRLMAPCAKIITAVFEKTLADYGPKAILTGNPITIPEKFPEFDELLSPLFKGDKPLVLILGGGTGAISINKLVRDTKNEILKFAHIIHVTGRNKALVEEKERDSEYSNSNKNSSSEDGFSKDNSRETILTESLGSYLSWELLSHERLIAIMASANLVISRCGLATLTEISALKKASILIPMPKSHQEDNALIFSRAGASLVLNEKDLNSEIFTCEIKNLLGDSERLKEYGENSYNIMEKNSAHKIANIIIELLKEKKPS